MVLRKTSGPKREEVTVGERRPHTENVQTVFLTTYHSGDQTNKNEMCGQLAGMGEGKGAYRPFLGMSEGRRPL
jgi:hypothetical protein